MAGRPILKRTCASPVSLGLCPKRKYPPLNGGIFIVPYVVKNNTPRGVGHRDLIFQENSGIAVNTTMPLFYLLISGLSVLHRI